MDKLPEELLLRIFKLLVADIEQLVILSQVSKRLNRYERKKTSMCV